MAALDTHKAIKALTGAGFNESQAEALVGLVDLGHGELATKTDLRTELQALELRMERRFHQITIQLVLLFVALAGVLAALELIPR